MEKRKIKNIVIGSAVGIFLVVCVVVMTVVTHNAVKPIFSSEGKITVSELKKAVENEYPDLKNRISIVNLDGVGNSVGAVICSNTPLPAAKTKDVYKIDEDTEIKFFSNTLPKIPAGEYSHNNLCKELAKVGVVECNTPNAIIVKEIAKQNLFILGLKFGGSKGAY